MVTAPTITAYDRDSKKVQIAVFGQKATLDAAKASLDELREGIDEEALGSLYHASVVEKDFEFYYYDVSGEEPNELVHWSDGQYTISEQK